MLAVVQIRACQQFGRGVSDSSSNATVIRTRLNDAKPFPLSGVAGRHERHEATMSAAPVAPIPIPVAHFDEGRRPRNLVRFLPRLRPSPAAPMALCVTKGQRPRN